MAEERSFLGEFRFKPLCECLSSSVALYCALYQGFTSLIALFNVMEVENFRVPVVVKN
jgi:hypothetical protein